MPNKLLNSVRWSLAYIFVVSITVCALITWTAYVRINDFETSHEKIAKTTVTTLAKEISDLIDNQQHLLRLFVKREGKLIQQLAQSPEDEDVKSEISNRLTEFFPDFFAFTVTDSDGNPFMDDFEGLVGDLCVNDIKEHAKGKPHLLRIHPNQHFYHIDFMVHWGVKEQKNGANKGGIFFVSFKPELISTLLKLSSPAGHELQLINRNIKNLIEITENGSRINLKRDDFRLTIEEQQRELYSLKVKETYWALTDFRDATLFTNFQNEIIKFSTAILLIFLSGSILMGVVILRAEKRRIVAEQLKEEMFSIFNHDLRAPLTVIDGFIQLFSDPSDVSSNPDRYKRIVDGVSHNIQFMQSMVNDILDIQKMEAGKMSFEFKDVELVSFVNNVVNMNKANAYKNNVNFIFETDIDEITIKADERRLTQALTNLLSNAVKYSPKNEEVTIQICKKSNGVMISVSDNGPGIEIEFQSQVFKKFSQSKSNLTRSVGGTGLGLSIVKYIIEAHKGKVTFVSGSDKGTAFNINLPVLY